MHPYEVSPTLTLGYDSLVYLSNSIMFQNIFYITFLSVLWGIGCCKFRRSLVRFGISSCILYNINPDRTNNLSWNLGCYIFRRSPWASGRSPSTSTKLLFTTFQHFCSLSKVPPRLALLHTFKSISYHGIYIFVSNWIISTLRARFLCN